MLVSNGAAVQSGMFRCLKPFFVTLINAAAPMGYAAIATTCGAGKRDQCSGTGGQQLLRLSQFVGCCSSNQNVL